MSRLLIGVALFLLVALDGPSGAPAPLRPPVPREHRQVVTIDPWIWDAIMRLKLGLEDRLDVFVAIEVEFQDDNPVGVYLVNDASSPPAAQAEWFMMVILGHWPQDTANNRRMFTAPLEDDFIDGLRSPNLTVILRPTSPGGRKFVVHGASVYLEERE